MPQVLRAAAIFDGVTLHRGCALLLEGGRVGGLIAADATPEGAEIRDLGGGILAPGLVDLQVNGGGGVLLGRGDPDTALATICAAHARLGTLSLLPTLITSQASVMRAVLAAGVRAARARLPGFAGLHLEGPFLDPCRKGAHDAVLIRPMTDADLALLTGAARDLPALLVTLAPVSVSPEQIAALAAAGVAVFLGHSDSDEAGAKAAFAAGARGVTHLYNAMSALTHRAPGLVGAALDAPVWAGIIPDGVHVAASAFRLALRAKPGRVFAVSDAMAVAGTGMREFTLNGRRIERRDGHLTLADGTLAGADISLPQALRWMVREAGVPPQQALAMVTTVPAQVLGRGDLGHLREGARADLVHLDVDFALRGVWRGGEPVI